MFLLKLNAFFSIITGEIINILFFFPAKMFTFLSNLLTLACFGLLSYDVKDDDVAFLLYTTKNTKSPISINITNFDMLDMNQEFKIITHGFTENTQSHFYLDLKDAYLKRGTYNVILLDWRNPAIRGLPANNIDAVGNVF